MRHTEVAQTPGHGGNDGQESIVADLSGGHIAQFGQAQIACHIVGIVAHSRPTAGRLDAEHQNDDQRQRHDDGLNQVGGGHRQETAQNGVDDDNCGTDQHGSRVVKAEQAVEQLTDGGKAGSGVGDEEYDNDKGANTAQKLPVVRKALGNELRYGDGVDLGGVNAQTLGHQQPVQICTHSQTDGRPGSVGHAGNVSHAGQTHQQPGTHVAGLGTHGRHNGVQTAAAQIEVGGIAGAAAGIKDTHHHHHAQIRDDGNNDTNISRVKHVIISPVLMLIR